jgi:hypothetical protein
LDHLLLRLRALYLGCDIEINQYDKTSGLPLVTHKGPIDSIDRGPNRAIAVTMKWLGMKDFAVSPLEYVATDTTRILVMLEENIQPDSFGRIILGGEIGGNKTLIVFFPKERGNMDPRKVRGIDARFPQNSSPRRTPSPRKGETA